jgi:hypothetical protein
VHSDWKFECWMIAKSRNQPSLDLFAFQFLHLWTAANHTNDHLVEYMHHWIWPLHFCRRLGEFLKEIRTFHFELCLHLFLRRFHVRMLARYSVLHCFKYFVRHNWFQVQYYIVCVLLPQSHFLIHLMSDRLPPFYAVNIVSSWTGNHKVMYTGRWIETLTMSSFKFVSAIELCIISTPSFFS